MHLSRAATPAVLPPPTALQGGAEIMVCAAPDELIKFLKQCADDGLRPAGLEMAGPYANGRGSDGRVTLWSLSAAGTFKATHLLLRCAGRGRLALPAGCCATGC